MPVLIIGGGKPSEDEMPEKPMKAKPARKFMGIGGKFASEPEPEEDEGEASEGSDGTEQAQMFIDAIASKNPRRVYEAFQAMMDSCSEMGD